MNSAGKHNKDRDYKSNLRFVMMSVTIMVVVLASISFVKIYIDKKQSAITKIKLEVNTLERVCLDNLNYSNIALKQIAALISYNSSAIEEIESIIYNYSLNNNSKNLFGWKNFYWIDNRKNVVVGTHTAGNIAYNSLSRLSHVKMSKIAPDITYYGIHDNEQKIFKVLDIVIGVRDSRTNEYVGSLMLSIDTSAILSDLELRKHSNKMNFAIFDTSLNIVASYPVRVNQAQILGNIEFKKAITGHDFISGQQEYVSHIDFMSGENYYAKKIQGMPLIISVNMDYGYLRRSLTSKIAVKLIEITITTLLLLILIVFIYKRETWLRSRAEKASRMAIKAMNAKSDFLAYVAHEIRSPLGFIMTGSEIMSKNLFGKVPEVYETYVNGIHNNAKLILDFINDILDEKHIISGNFKMSITHCNVAELVDRAISTNKTRFHTRKININNTVDDNLPFIQADPNRLLQIFNNIISNAYKYSCDGTEISINISYTKSHVIVCVSDQGIGMSNAEIDIALTKYGTVHNNKSPNWIESYGLGLPIVKMLLDAHNGNMEITSQIDVGTEVKIILPRESSKFILHSKH
jgi:signal transduction histidine kinase